VHSQLNISIFFVCNGRHRDPRPALGLLDLPNLFYHGSGVSFRGFRYKTGDQDTVDGQYLGGANIYKVLDAQIHTDTKPQRLFSDVKLGAVSTTFTEPRITPLVVSG
jgi:hypothetical protein